MPWKEPPAPRGESQAGLCPLLTQVMAGPAGSVTGSYISRSFLRTSALMGCISGNPSRTTSACFTGSPGDRAAQTVPKFPMFLSPRVRNNPVRQENHPKPSLLHYGNSRDSSSAIPNGILILPGLKVWSMGCATSMVFFPCLPTHLGCSHRTQDGISSPHQRAL